MRQRARREQEEGARRREELQSSIADRFALPVRQREGDGADDVDGDALYRDYANPAAPEHGPPNYQPTNPWTRTPLADIWCGLLRLLPLIVSNSLGAAAVRRP